MFCPECNAEYRRGFTRCPDCDAALVSALPPEEMDTDHGEEEVAVFVTRDMTEAETVKELLEAHRVDVYIAGESSPLPGVPSEVRLIVNQARAEVAHEIIEDFRVAEDDEEEDKSRGKVVPFPVMRTSSRS